MRGRIKLALTSSTLIAAAAAVYHFTEQKLPVVQPAAPPSVASITPVQPPVEPPMKPAAKPPARHIFRAAMANAELGMASWYGDLFNGKRTANGEIFDKNQLTACHRSLPFGTLVRVINVTSGRSVIVRINDRGVMSSRIIDLSHAAADEIGMLGAGVAKVRLEILGKVHDAASRPL